MSAPDVPTAAELQAKVARAVASSARPRPPHADRVPEGPGEAGASAASGGA